MEYVPFAIVGSVNRWAVRGPAGPISLTGLTPKFEAVFRFVLDQNLGDNKLPMVVMWDVAVAGLEQEMLRDIMKDYRPGQFRTTALPSDGLPG